MSSPISADRVSQRLFQSPGQSDLAGSSLATILALLSAGSTTDATTVAAIVAAVNASDMPDGATKTALLASFSPIRHLWAIPTVRSRTLSAAMQHCPQGCGESLCAANDRQRGRPQSAGQLMPTLQQVMRAQARALNKLTTSQAAAAATRKAEQLHKEQLQAQAKNER